MSRDGRVAVDALASVDPELLDPAELGDLLVEAAGQRDRLTAICARVTAVHDRRAAWQAEGARSQKEWLTDRCRLDPGVAGRQSRDARHLAELPRTAAAFAAGTIPPPKPPPPREQPATCPPLRWPGWTGWWSSGGRWWTRPGARSGGQLPAPGRRRCPRRA